MRSVTRIDAAPVALEEIRRKLQTTTFNSIREALPDHAIEETCRSVGLIFRNRLIPPIVTVLHMVMAAFWPEDSFAASWQVMWGSMVSRLPGAAGRSPSSGSVAKARARLPLAFWEKLFAWLSTRCQAASEPNASWRGHRVVLLDGSCCSMQDTPELRAAFGSVPDGHYPLMRIVTAALAQTATVLAYMTGRYDESEKNLAARVLDGLRRGDLIVGDRGFAGAALYAAYLRRGLQFVTRMHHAVKVSRLRRLEIFGTGDFVAEMMIPPAYRRQDALLPKRVMVRVISAGVRIRGKRRVLWLVTSLLDAEAYPAGEIVELYARRWRIETLFRELKVAMKADVFRSLTPDGVRKELAARMIALNAMRVIILEAAAEHGADPLRLSFSHAVRAVIVFAPAIATAPAWQLPEIYRAMLTEIASHLVPLRPGRNEPRAVRRERIHYPNLRTTRRIWRLEHVA
jgi:hypothetical protein